MSSSRAVSMRIGTSDDDRIWRHTSSPSMSGSMRSSTTRSGFAFSALLSASAPSRAISTWYRAFFRYIETNDAMFRSSSTIRIFSAITLRVPYRRDVTPGPRRSEGEVPAKRRPRPPVAAVDRVAPRPLDVGAAAGDDAHVDAGRLQDLEAPGLLGREGHTDAGELPPAVLEPDRAVVPGGRPPAHPG